METNFSNLNRKKVNPQLKTFLMGAATVVVGVAIYDFILKPQILKLSMKTPPATK